MGGFLSCRRNFWVLSRRRAHALKHSTANLGKTPILAAYLKKV
ncbi:Uncharacterised protein [Bordetella pertussis]|nr:Uncharacterised protein [Bordetella pertussis]